MKKIVLFILIHLWSFSYLAKPTGNTRLYLEVLDISKKENTALIKQNENPLTLLSEKVSSNYIYQIGFCTIENFKQSQQEIKHGENSFFIEIKFRIRDKKSQELIFEELITRDNNFPKKEENYFDLFPINFDSIEDVKIITSNSIHYILSYKNDEETIHFYTEKFLKNCKEFNRNEVEKKLTFEESEYQMNQRKTFEFSGIQFDTIRIFSQTTNKPIYTQEFTFLNFFDRGRPRQIGERKNLPPRLKKEIADYNGDGAVDYRIEEGVRIESNWNYFIWDKKKNIYVYDSLLSSMSTTFSQEEKKLVGEKYESKNGARIYSKYEFINQTFTVVERKECVSIHDQSEKSVCNIYKLDKGKLVLVESYPTAE